MKTIVESFEGSGILVPPAAISWQTTDLATQLFKIRDQYQRLFKIIVTMESAMYTVKGAVEAIQEFYFGEVTCSINS